MGAAVQDDLGSLRFADAAVVQHIAVRPHDLQPSAVKGVAAFAQMGQRFQRAAQPLLGAVPVKKCAVERVTVALHGDLVAIVDAGHAGQREDHRIAQQQLAHGIVHFFGRDAPPALPVAVPPVGRLASNGGDGAFGVVGGKEIHRAVQRRGRVVLTDGQDLLGHSGCVAAGHKAQRRAAERVVHHGIQPLAAQVGAPLAEGLLRCRILPHFADQQLVLAVGLHGLADALNKRVGQLVGHVKAEARSTQPEPGVDDAALAADKVDVGRRVLLHFGQGLKAPPAAVAAGIARVKIVPAAVRRVAVAVGTARAIAPLAVEVDRVRPCMAEHAVQNDADALFRGSRAQGGKLLVRAQQRVGFQVVGRVVAVVGVGLKDGVQIDAADA